MPDEPSESSLVEFLAVMRQLRAECDWKRAQTHRSLARYLLEETHETLEAIDEGAASGDWEHLREELGDLLLQVYFHAVIAEESGAFTLEEVAAGIVAKMRRRNPHVFGSVAACGPAAVNELWESVKATEQPSRSASSSARDSILDGLPPMLPALLYADKALDRLERHQSLVRSSGWDQVDKPAVALAADSVGDGLDGDGPDGDEAAQTRIGDQLLSVVGQARADGVDPEQALRDAVRRLLA